MVGGWFWFMLIDFRGFLCGFRWILAYQHDFVSWPHLQPAEERGQWASGDLKSPGADVTNSASWWLGNNFLVTADGW